MALSELSVNNLAVRDGRRLETPPNSLPDDGPHAAADPRTPGQRVKPGLLTTPSSIQSMPQNTAHVGDVIELSSKRTHSKVSSANDTAHHATRQWSHGRALGAVRSETRGQHQYVPSQNLPLDRGTPYSIAHSQHGTTSGASSIYSLYRNRSETSFRSHSHIPSRGPSRGPEGHEYSSYLIAQPITTTSRLVGNHGPPSSHYQDGTSMRGMRPRSPFVYPTRLRRLGYRPSSPALSEIYRSPEISTPGPLGAHGFRTNSPLSLHKADIRIAGRQQHLNRSDPMLSRSQPSPNRQHHGRHYRFDVGERKVYYPNTYHRAPAPMSGAPRPNIAYLSSPGDQPPPLFYDYSEDFQQGSIYLYPHSMSYETDQHRLREHAHNDPYELDTTVKDGLESAVFELPAEPPTGVHEAKRRSKTTLKDTDSLKDARVESNRSSIATSPRRSAVLASPLTHQIDTDFERGFRAPSGRDTVRNSSLSATAAMESSNKNSMTCFIKRNARSSIENRKQQENLVQNMPNGEHVEGHRMLPSFKRSQKIQAARTDCTNNGTEVSLYTRSSSCSSSSDVSMYPTHSASQPQRQPPRTGDQPTRSESSSADENPSKEAHSTMPDCAENALSGTASSLRPEPAGTEIYSPIPQRLVSSTESQDRFSSILSIDERHSDLDATRQDSGKLPRSSIRDTMSRRIRSDSRSESLNAVHQERHASWGLRGIRERHLSLGQEGPESTTTKVLENRSGHAGRFQKEFEARKGMTPAKPQSVYARESDPSELDTRCLPHRATIESLGLQTIADSASKLYAHDRFVAPHADPTDTTVADPSVLQKSDRAQITNPLPVRPRSSIVSFAPLQRRESGHLPFAFSPLRPEELEDGDSVIELGKLAASYLNQRDRRGSETSCTLPREERSKASG